MGLKSVEVSISRAYQDRRNEETHTLIISVRNIRKEDLTAWMYFGIVKGVELTSVIVVQYYSL